MSKDLGPVGDAIKLLTGDREEEFSLERPLRLFQFKAWLLDDRSTLTSFRQSALVFTSLAIRQEQLRKRQTRLTPSERLLLTIASEKTRPLIDFVFQKSSLFALTQIWWLPFRKTDVEDGREEIEVLNALSRFRLRLHFTKGMDPSVNNGAALLAQSPDSTRRSERGSKAIRAKRRARESFLFASELDDHPKTIFPVGRDAQLDAIHQEAKNIENLRSYFSRSKALISILDVEAADALGECWPALPSGEGQPLEPVTDDELDIAGIKPSVRRSAETTRVGRRQASAGAK